MTPLKAVIIDDESLSRNLLRMMLEEHCPGIVLAGEAETLSDARKLMAQQPDVVFLDIEMPQGSGFDLLEDIQHSERIQTVFVTAYSQYALKALKSGAAEYLLKPVDVEELKHTVQKLHNRIQERYHRASSMQMREQADQKLILSHHNGFKVIDIDHIIWLKADNNYTEIYTDNEPVILVSKPIRDFEHRLDHHWFFRTHKSQIINLRHFREYIIKDGCSYARMSDNTKVSISRLRVQDFLNHITQVATGI